MANVDDPTAAAKLVKELFGKLYGAKGYISPKLFDLLFADGVQLVTKIRKNINHKLMDAFDQLMLRKQAIIETIYDQLKNISQIEHIRHRSGISFLLNVVSALIADTHREKKPSLNLRSPQWSDLPTVIL